MASAGRIAKIFSGLKTTSALETYMAANNILPTSQHGFRKERSCTTASATANAAWVARELQRMVNVTVAYTKGERTSPE
jgi:carbonic anhydrase